MPDQALSTAAENQTQVVGNTALAITVFTKRVGVLTKKIKLNGDGSIQSDGSECRMWKGRARRQGIKDIGHFADVIGQLESDQAIALGALRADLPDKVRITTKKIFDRLNGKSAPDIIARVSGNIEYAKERPALALLDFDTKGMPPDVAAELKRLGGFWEALCTVLPDLRDAAHVLRYSTSAGLFRKDTGAHIKGSDGIHAYIVAQDGADIERFLKTLHERCWLAGLGWMMVSVSGALLERSIVDRMVGSPERLVFEGPPVLVPPLTQDQESRRPIVHDGEFVDTVAACPPLTILQENTLEELKAQASLKLAPDITKARKKFIVNQATKLVEQTSISIKAAERVIERQCRGVLLPDVELVLVDGQTITVGDVLADPDRFEGYSLADPLEGTDYGRSTAKILLRADGTPWIRSFAHGLTNYKLKYDARAVRAAIESSPLAEKINVFAEHTLDAELDAVELKEITQEVAKTTKIGVRVIEAKLKSAKLEQAKQHAEEQRERQIAERNDPRPRLMTQPEEKPWLPQIKSITEALKLTPRLQQTRRNIDGVTAYAHTQVIPNTYAFVSSTKKDDQND